MYYKIIITRKMAANNKKRLTWSRKRNSLNKNNSAGSGTPEEIQISDFLNALPLTFYTLKCKKLLTAARLTAITSSILFTQFKNHGK